MGIHPGTATVVDLRWKNATGATTTPAAERALFVGMLDRGEASREGLAIAASRWMGTAIHLTGLATNGLEFVAFGG